MSATRKRGLRIDDPIAAAARPSSAVTNPTSTKPGGAVQPSRLRELPVTQIHPNPDQPRKRFDEDALAALADSIRERGVLQPIIVRPDPAGGYQLVAGERRWRAAQLAGEPTIPALIDDHLDEPGSLELALIENVVREDLTPIEEARTIAVLLEDLRVTATVLSKRLGRSRTDIAHTVRLLDLPDEAIHLIDTGALTKGHGKALLTEPDHHRRRALASHAATAGLSVRALETEIARASNPPKPPPRPHPDACAAAATLQDAITRATGCDAQARPHHRGYQITLNQAAAEKLAQILARASR
jgi:ParB family transcriptional regulator, chromosome partitioning protein